MDPITLVIIGAALAVALGLGAVVFIVRRIVVVEPDEAGIVVGRPSTVTMPDGSTHDLGFTILKGGWTFVRPVKEKYRTISLQTTSIPVQIPEVFTKSGVPLSIDSFAQVKVKSDLAGIATAAEQLLEQDTTAIAKTAQRQLEGHIRIACAQLEIEAINSDRAALGEKVQKEAVPDLNLLGLELTTFTIKDISDNNGYLKALGQKKLAEVQRDAAVGKAEAERDAAIKVAEAKREQETATAQALERDLKIKKTQAQAEGQQAEAQRQAEVAEAIRDRDVRVEASRAQTVKAKATADQAYAIEAARAQQALAEEQARLKEKEAVVTERDQLIRTVIPAQKAADAAAAHADGERRSRIAEAQAESESIRLKGVAEAEAIRLKGLAEAEATRAKALALKEYNDAGLQLEIVRTLPAIAEAMAKPLENTEKIVVLSGSGSEGNELVDWTSKGMVKLPELVKAFTGKNMSELIQEAAQAASSGVAAGLVQGNDGDPNN